MRVCYFQPKSGARPIHLAFVGVQGLTVGLPASPDSSVGRRLQVDVEVGVPDCSTDTLLDGATLQRLLMQGLAPPDRLGRASLPAIAERLIQNLFKNGALTCELTVSFCYTGSDLQRQSYRLIRKAN